MRGMAGPLSSRMCTSLTCLSVEKSPNIRGGQRERCPWRGIPRIDYWESKKYKKNLKRMKRDGVGLLVSICSLGGLAVLSRESSDRVGGDRRSLSPRETHLVLSRDSRHIFIA